VVRSDRLAVTSDKRYGGLPDVPTVAESGVRGYQAASWNGVAAPARTPKALIDRLNREVNAATGSPEVRKRLQEPWRGGAWRGAGGVARSARLRNCKVESRNRASEDRETVGRPMTKPISGGSDPNQTRVRPALGRM